MGLTLLYAGGQFAAPILSIGAYPWNLFDGVIENKTGALIMTEDYFYVDVVNKLYQRYRCSGLKC